MPPACCIQMGSSPISNTIPIRKPIQMDGFSYWYGIRDRTRLLDCPNGQSIRKPPVFELAAATCHRHVAFRWAWSPISNTIPIRKPIQMDGFSYWYGIRDRLRLLDCPNGQSIWSRQFLNWWRNMPPACCIQMFESLSSNNIKTHPNETHPKWIRDRLIGMVLEIVFELAIATGMLHSDNGQYYKKPIQMDGFW